MKNFFSVIMAILLFFGIAQTAESAVRNEITLRDNLAGGTITANETLAEAGETVLLFVTPSSGYALDSITAYNTNDSETEVPLLFSLDNDSTRYDVYEFAMPDYPVTVDAVFYETGDVSEDDPGGTCSVSGPGFGLFALAVWGAIEKRRSNNVRGGGR